MYSPCLCMSSFPYHVICLRCISLSLSLSPHRSKTQNPTAHPFLINRSINSAVPLFHLSVSAGGALPEGFIFTCNTWNARSQRLLLSPLALIPGFAVFFGFVVVIYNLGLLSTYFMHYPLTPYRAHIEYLTN